MWRSVQPLSSLTRTSVGVSVMACRSASVSLSPTAFIALSHAALCSPAVLVSLLMVCSPLVVQFACPHTQPNLALSAPRHF